MKRLKSTFLVLLMALIALISYYMYVAITDDGGDKGAQEESSSVEESTGDKTKKTTISIVAVGDNFTHESVVESGKQSDGSYNYDFLFENIKSYVEEADIAAIFQTMIIAGNDMGVSGYPTFNSPEEMITAIDSAGFDVALMASNHTTDMGTVGIKNCISLWENQSDVLAVGIHDDAESVAEIPIIEVEGKKIAILNYTTNMNIPIANESDQYMVNYLGELDSSTGSVSETQISEEFLETVKRADEQADCVIVFPYWGNEYDHDITEVQRAWAKAMTEAGADLIIGARSHYLNEIEEITSDNGNTAMCYYSIGNFCSSFNYTDAMVGGMAKVTLILDDDKVSIDEDNSGIIPIVTHYTHSGNAEDESAVIKGVYPVSMYTADMASSHGIITRGNVDFSMELIENIISTNIDSKYLISE